METPLSLSPQKTPMYTTTHGSAIGMDVGATGTEPPISLEDALSEGVEAMAINSPGQELSDAASPARSETMGPETEEITRCEGAIARPTIQPYEPDMLEKRYARMVNLEQKKKPVSSEWYGWDDRCGDSPDSPEKREATRRLMVERYRHSAEIAQEVGEIFTIWGKENLQRELARLKHQVVLPGDSVEKGILLRREWVQNSLSLQYRAYVQRYTTPIGNIESVRSGGTRGSKTKAKAVKIPPVKVPLGGQCLYPGCDRKFQENEYRISFEPMLWSQPLQILEPESRRHRTPQRKTNEVHLDLNFNPRSSNAPLSIPDYKKLVCPVNVSIYGNGEVYCIRCFEDLLQLESDSTEPVSPPSPLPKKVMKSKKAKKSKKRKELPVTETIPWFRPSPSRRVYSLIFPENRYDPEGRFLLDDEACQVIDAWKNCVFSEGIKEMREKHAFLGPEEDIALDEDEAAEEGPLYTKEAGIGLPECLWLMETARTGYPKRPRA